MTLALVGFIFAAFIFAGLGLTYADAVNHAHGVTADSATNAFRGTLNLLAGGLVNAVGVVLGHLYGAQKRRKDDG